MMYMLKPFQLIGGTLQNFEKQVFYETLNPIETILLRRQGRCLYSIKSLFHLQNIQHIFLLFTFSFSFSEQSIAKFLLSSTHLYLYITLTLHSQGKTRKRLTYI